MSELTAGKQKARHKLKEISMHKLKAQMEVQSMVWPGLIFLIIFSYLPLYGILIAFKDYDLLLGVADSPWVGLEHFKAFWSDPYLANVVRNTIFINALGLLIGFPAPILFALLLNELTSKKYKSFVQTISYLPHFVSWVVFGGLVLQVLSPSNGILNAMLMAVGLIDEPVNFIGRPGDFWMIYIFSDMIKGLGWGAILYIAAIAGVDQEMYEAATIDGANRYHKMIYLTVPSILGTVMIMLIFAISAILNTGIEQVLILQNALNLDTSEMIDSYVYKLGLQQMRYSFSTAVGLTKSVIALILLLLANYISRKITDKGLF